MTIETLDELYDAVFDAQQQAENERQDPKRIRVGVSVELPSGQHLLCDITDWGVASYHDSEGVTDKIWLSAQPMVGQKI